MKKIKRKISAFLLAFAMILGVMAPSVARAAVGVNKTEVNIRKLELTEKKTSVPHDLSKLDNESLKDKLQLGNVNDVKGLNGVTFSYVKLDSYDDYKSVEEDKPNTLEQLNAIVGLSRNDYTDTPLDPTADKNGEAGWTSKELEDGYYWFFEKDRPSTVTEAIAVPFGLTLPYQNLEGIGADGNKDPNSKAGTVTMKKIFVYPKNVTKNDQIDKGFGKVTDKSALDSELLSKWEKEYGPDYAKYLADKDKIDARIGSVVDFETKTKLNKGKIFKAISWTDMMTDGLEYVDNSLTITAIVKKATDESQNIVIGTDVTVNKHGVAPHFYGFDVEDKDTFVVDKLNKWLKEGDVEFTFKYKAKVTKESVVDQPESNNITFNPHKPNHNDKTTQPTNGNIDVEKTWSDGQVPADKIITYNLIDKTDNKIVASVTLKNKNAGDAGIQSKSLNDGITVENKGNYKVKFSGLIENHDYSVEEFANGYKPDYVAGDQIQNIPSPDSIHPTPPQLVTGGKKFVKTNQDGTARLAGAKFYITNPEENKYLAIVSSTDIQQAVTDYTTAETKYQEAIEAYNKLSAEEQGQQAGTQAKELIKTTKADRDAKFLKARQGYQWKELTGDIATATDKVVLTSDDQGRFEISGLAYGTYKLVEFVAPPEYAKLSSPVEFTISASSYSTVGVDFKYNTGDQASNAKQVINKKVTIPETGGIGTIIFTVIGLAVMGGALVAMRKRNLAENK